MLIFPKRMTLLIALITLALIPKVKTMDLNSAKIMIGKTATETERYAASELKRYLAAITGAAPAIMTDNMPHAKFLFIVGRTALSSHYLNEFDKAKNGPGSDSFIIDSSDNKIILIGGGDRGTLYSVYEFLEQQGCRWFFPGKLGEVIPKRSKLIIPEEKKKYVPDFVQRSIGLSHIEGIDFEDIIDWAAKNRLNRAFGLRYYFVRKYLPSAKWNAWTKRGGMQEWQWICHNFNFMVPSGKYFKTHPEYYALYKGKRLPMGSPGHPGYGGGNLCTTNKDVIKLCADFAINWFDKHPDGIVVPMWPNDGAIKWCECKNCKKLGGINFMPGKRGSMSRRMVTFANKVAKIVGQKYPDRYILCPAYSNYTRPVDVPMEKNILVQICPHGDYAHALNKSEVNKQEREWLEAWASRTRNRMGVWDYFLLGDHYSAPKENTAMLPVAYRAADNLKYLNKTGVNWYYTQSSPKYWKHNMFPFYITARFAWNSKQNFTEFMTDFFNKLYGKAGPQVMAYYKLIEDKVATSDWHPQIYSDVAVPSQKVFTPELLEKCDSLLQQAKQAKLSKIEQERLALVSATFEFIKSNVGTQAMLGLDANSSWRLKRNKDHYLMNADGKAIPEETIKKIIRHAIDSGKYNTELKRLLFRARKRKVPIINLENDSIKLSVIPELGGRIIRLIDKESGLNIIKESPGSDELKTIGEMYFNYGGYEEYASKSFAGPGWEAEFKYSLNNKDHAKSIVMEAELDNYKLERKITLHNGTDCDVTVESKLTNISSETRKATLRAHPMMTLGKDAGSHKLYYQKDNKQHELLVSQAHDRFFKGAENFWAVTNPQKNIGLINYFDSSQATPYLCQTGSDCFNLELMGKEKTLKPGESLTLKHSYKVLKNIDSKTLNMKGKK